MPRSIARLPIEVTPEKAEAIDVAVGHLQIITGQRQTRASFIRSAIDHEIERVEAEFKAKQRAEVDRMPGFRPRSESPKT